MYNYITKVKISMVPAPLRTKELLLDFIYGYYIVAEMELENGRKITNMYYHVVPRNKEYEPNQY
jgi:hypothetical protein